MTIGVVKAASFMSLKNKLPVLVSWFWYLLFGIFSQTAVGRS